jgi:hypothetical protein
MREYSERFYRLLMIRVRAAICDTIRKEGGRMLQADLQKWIQIYSDEEKSLRRLSKDGSEEAFLFVFGALIQLMSEKIITTDLEEQHYLLKSPTEG